MLSNDVTQNLKTTAPAWISGLWAVLSQNSSKKNQCSRYLLFYYYYYYYYYFYYYYYYTFSFVKMGFVECYSKYHWRKSEKPTSRNVWHGSCCNLLLRQFSSWKLILPLIIELHWIALIDCRLWFNLTPGQPSQRLSFPDWFHRFNQCQHCALKKKSDFY